MNSEKINTRPYTLDILIARWVFDMLAEAFLNLQTIFASVLYGVLNNESFLLFFDMHVNLPSSVNDKK